MNEAPGALTSKGYLAGMCRLNRNEDMREILVTLVRLDGGLQLPFLLRPFFQAYPFLKAFLKGKYREM